MEKINQALMQTAPAVTLTTITKDGYPRSRSMLNLRNVEQYPSLIKFFSGRDSHEFFFTTNLSSSKMEDIRYNSKAGVYFCDAGNWHGLTLTGDITIVEDRAIRLALWQPDWSIYYTGGVESTDYVILYFSARVEETYYHLEKKVKTLYNTK